MMISSKKWVLRWSRIARTTSPLKVIGKVLMETYLIDPFLEDPKDPMGVIECYGSFIINFFGLRNSFSMRVISQVWCYCTNIFGQKNIFVWGCIYLSGSLLWQTLEPLGLKTIVSLDRDSRHNMSSWWSGGLPTNLVNSQRTQMLNLISTILHLPAKTVFPIETTWNATCFPCQAIRCLMGPMYTQ